MSQPQSDNQSVTKSAKRKKVSPEASPPDLNKKSRKLSKSDIDTDENEMGLSAEDLVKIGEVFDLKLASLVKRVETAEQKIVKLEKSALGKNVVISGVKEETNQNNPENVLQTVTALFSKIGANNVLIDDVYRVGKKSSNDRPIIVKFVRMIDKRILMSKRKSLGPGIFLNDDTTKEQRKDLSILREFFRRKKQTDVDITKSFRGQVMTIWKNGTVAGKFKVEEGIVKQITTN